MLSAKKKRGENIGFFLNVCLEKEMSRGGGLRSGGMREGCVSRASLGRLSKLNVVCEGDLGRLSRV
jgi:hypothetical protein